MWTELSDQTSEHIINQNVEQSLNVKPTDRNHWRSVKIKINSIRFGTFFWHLSELFTFSEALAGTAAVRQNK